MLRRNGSKASGLWSGRPSTGLRACRWTIAAPAYAAPSALSAISSAVTGRCGDIEGVWIEPVTAQLMMTFLWAMLFPPGFSLEFCSERRPLLSEPFAMAGRRDRDQRAGALVMVQRAQVRRSIFRDDDVRIHAAERDRA